MPIVQGIKMNSIRAAAVKHARSMGICTQCLKHPATQHMYQCQRCIDTNRKKYRRVNEMGTKPKGMDTKEFNDIERDKKRRKRERNAEQAKLRYHKQQAALGKEVNVRDPMSEGTKEKIRRGIALSQARRDAFGNKDTMPSEIRRYKKKLPVASLQMAGMVNDLERFIGNMKMMSAVDYLEAREDLIMSIIKRGGKLNGSV